MGFGGMIVIAVSAKPGRRIITLLRQLFLGRQCVQCHRVEGEEITDETFKGPRKLGMCPRCHGRYRTNKLSLSRTAAAKYDASLIRKGLLITKDVAKELREDVYFRAAAAAKKGD